MKAGASDVRAAKQVLRSRLRRARRQRPVSEQQLLAAELGAVVLELPEIRRAECLTLYASLPGEPGTEPLRRALLARDSRVLLPVVLPDLDLDWALDTGPAAQAPSAHGGGPEPVGTRLGPDAVAGAEVLLVPALAVDTLGHRLGQGGGCYDRALARTRPEALVMALLYDDEVLDAGVEPVPAEAHDRGVDVVITPTRWMWISERLRL